ncbi:MAG: ATP-binding cassette domain-containing protein [Candidatus Thiodiazotropha taylori]
MVRSPLVAAQHLRISDTVTGRTLLDDIDFTVASGESAAILGESGAGKTLLGRCLAGSAPKNIQVQTETNDGSTLALTIVENARVTFVPQAPALPPLLPVERLISMALQWSPTHKSTTDSGDRVAELLNWVSFPTDTVSLRKRPFQLSGGQTQRVALAAALATSPSLLILDEPTVGLDPLLREDLCQVLLELNREHDVSLLITTHDIPAAAIVAQRALVLKNGRSVAEGNWDKLLADTNPYIQQLLSPLALFRENADIKSGRDSEPVGHIPRYTEFRTD